MSYADELFVKMCRDILDNGTDTKGEKVRPKWEDTNESAYTIKRFKPLRFKKRISGADA